MFVDDLWWLVYAIVFGVAFLIILMLIMFVCCLENAEENKYVTCFKIAKDCSFGGRIFHPPNTPLRKYSTMIQFCKSFDKIFIFIN